MLVLTISRVFPLSVHIYAKTETERVKEWRASVLDTYPICHCAAEQFGGFAIDLNRFWRGHRSAGRGPTGTAAGTLRRLARTRWRPRRLARARGIPHAVCGCSCGQGQVYRVWVRFRVYRV